MQGPADRLNIVSTLYADVPVLMKDLPADATVWCAGRRKPDLIRAIREHRPGIRPVLIGKDRDELFLERDVLQDIPSMGFLRALDQPGWTTGLPYPVHAASLAFRFSALHDAARIHCIGELAEKMSRGGILIWSDFFLPQTLELQALYLAEYARLSGEDSADTGEFEQSFLTHHPNPVLLETAISEVYAGGFANAEIVSKRLGVAVLMARK